MGDNDFLVLWMFAAHRSGQPDRADQILSLATENAAHYGRPVSAELQRRAQRLRDETSQVYVLPSAQAAEPMRPTSSAHDRRTMSEPTVNFNNHAGSVIHSQIATVQGGLTINTTDGLAEEKPFKGVDEDSADEFGAKSKSVRGDINGGA